MIFAPYHVILECGKPVWAFRKSLITARKNIRLIITISSIKVLLFILVSVVFMNQLSFLILTILDIIMAIAIAYRCLEEIRNDQ